MNVVMGFCVVGAQRSKRCSQTSSLLFLFWGNRFQKFIQVHLLWKGEGQRERNMGWCVVAVIVNQGTSRQLLLRST